MKTLNRAVVLGFLLTLSCSFALAQGKRVATEAFNRWKSGLVANAGSDDVSFQNVAIAVAPRASSGLTVNLAVGSSMDVKGISALTFTVQEIVVTKSGVEEVGKNAKLFSPAIQRSKADTDEVMFTPQIVLPDTGKGNAIRVMVSGFDGQPDGVLTVIVPIGSDTRTSVVGRVQINPKASLLEDEGQCVWWVGSCETCFLCVGCDNNSPNFNCPNCTMNCSGAEPCTPSGPKPVNCP